MKKKHCIITQMILLLWFFLDMIGIYFGDKCLVTRSYKEDGIFFLIYLIAVVLFIIKDIELVLVVDGMKKKLNTQKLD